VSFVSQPFMASLTVDQRLSLTALGYHPETGDTFFIPQLDRCAGMYILGVQSSGKSRLLQNLINADIQAGRPVIVIDPHGDLTTNCLALVPGDRLKDTFLLDMEDEAFPFGVNVFSTGKLTNDLAQTQAVNRIEHIFGVLWPEVMSQAYLPRYLRAAIITLLANPGTTLVDMYTFLQDQAFRARLLHDQVRPDVRQFWATQYDNLSPHERYQRVQPLIGRLEALFMGRSLVRNIVGQRRTTIDFRQAIEQHQIIFIKLPIKQIEQDARLIGTILLAQIHAAIFSFANMPEAQRPGVSLFMDEFQHVATGDIEELFTEGRKFGVRLTIAHQYRDKLPPFLRPATMTAKTKACFRLTPDDSREMAQLFQSQEATVLPEDIEVHPVHYLLTHPSNDPALQVFAETYLHPLQGYKRGAGRVEIENWKIGGPHLASMLTNDYSNPRVSDPTHRLDSLLYDVMQSGNPWLPIPPEIVEGFSNCGRGFYKQAIGIGYNDPLLQPDARFPRHLVVQAPNGELRWTRPPDSSTDQLFHFVFHLRMVMVRLAEGPIGKATVASPAEVAKMLTSLPNRALFVTSADTGGTLYTFDTFPIVSQARALVFKQIAQVLTQTRARYGKPRADVERDLQQPPDEPDTSGGAPVKNPPPQPPGQPARRWEEIA
jgi:hypothetical protein